MRDLRKITRVRKTMLKNKMLLITFPLCISLMACGGSDGKSVPSSEASYDAPELIFSNTYEVMEGDSIRIDPTVNVDDSLTYNLDWTMTNGDAVEFSTDDEVGVVNTSAVSEDIDVSFAVTVTDSKDQTNTASFTVTVKNEIIDTVEMAIKNLERTNTIPVLDYSESLVGNDENDDGVRDDIAQLIASEPVTDEQKVALIEIAKGLQNTLVVDLTNEQEVSELGEKSALNAVCLALKFEKGIDASKYLGRIEAAMMNTSERADKYEAYNAARHGSVTRLPDFSSCL